MQATITSVEPTARRWEGPKGPVCFLQGMLADHEGMAQWNLGVKPENEAARRGELLALVGKAGEYVLEAKAPYNGVRQVKMTSWPGKPVPGGPAGARQPYQVRHRDTEEGMAAEQDSIHRSVALQTAAANNQGKPISDVLAIADAMYQFLRHPVVVPVAGPISQATPAAVAAPQPASTSPVPPPSALPPCPACGNTTAIIKGKAEYGGGLVCWSRSTRGKPGCGHQWHPDAPAAPAAPAAPNKEDEQCPPFGQTKPTYPSDVSQSKLSQEDELIPPERLKKLLAVVEENDLGLWFKKTLKNEFYIDDPAKLRLMHVDHMGQQLKKALSEQEKDVKRLRDGIREGNVSKEELYSYLAGCITLGPKWVAVLEKEIAG